jgi:uncharacterized protein
MKIAIIGTGISGLTAAYLLHPHHDITVLEKSAEIGGHTATKNIQLGGKHYAIDTGFIVYNDWTYPHFIRLLTRLGVDTQATTMGFSVTDPASDYEYAGTNLDTLFCQRRNLFDRQHWRLLYDIVRFNRLAKAHFEQGLLAPDMTLGRYVDQHGFGEFFIHRYLLPMGAAIWSMTPQALRDFPVYFFVRFCRNHGLLNIVKRPQWRVLKGGSAQYLAPLTAGFADRIRTEAKIESISRREDGVAIRIAGATEHFDALVMACHSDQGLALLSDASPDERRVLGAIGYRDNDVVLHTDTRLLPRAKSAWCSWNYQLNANPQVAPVLTYNMNILQGLQADETFCVTLNAIEQIAPERILGRYRYAHPVFTPEAHRAQADWAHISGVQHTHFCGAYWFNGFHEDGVVSALRVAAELGGDRL